MMSNASEIGPGGLRRQRRGRSIAMSQAERDEYLRPRRTCRMATTGTQGPHATALWFHWDGEALWFSSLARSQRWADLARDPRVAVVIDDGDDYAELRGIELRGQVEVVGDVPHVSETDPVLTVIDQAFADKYTGGVVVRDGRHGWLRMRPDKISSWDFRKLPQDRSSAGASSTSS
ncbi:MAG: hypothetical protein QOH84_1187 [Kribbellaceae bacterium]|nr:hypothetical protein [Kribbellaceae bacterium]